MDYLREENGIVFAECEYCKRNLKFKKNMLISVKGQKIGYELPEAMECFCGESLKNIVSNVVTEEFKTDKKNANDCETNKGIKCPNCHAQNITINPNNFSTGKAVVGTLLIGPMGMLAGTAGSNKTRLVCLNCGHQWEIGK